MQNINMPEAFSETTNPSNPGGSSVCQLNLGRRWHQEGRWQDAIKAYATALRANPLVSLPIVHLLEESRTGYLRERSVVLKKKPEAARLVRIMEADYGSISHDSSRHKLEDEPGTLILPRDAGDLADWAWRQVALMPSDCVTLLGTSMPLVLAGLFYKILWGATVLVDKSAKEDPSARKLIAVTIDQLKVQGNGLPDPQHLHNKGWTQLAIELNTRFDGLIKMEHPHQWQKALRQPRRPVDGAQLNCLEALAPTLASPLMAARFWRWNQERIDWAELQGRQWDPDLVSIVIPVYGDPGELDECLHSVRIADSTKHWEVLAVMNDATENSKKILEKHCKCDSRIRGIWPGENVQFALGCNLGFAASQGGWLVLLNNDCRVRSGWLDGLIQPLRDAAVAATQPRLVKPNGTVQSLGVVFHDGQTLGYPLYAGLPVHFSCVQKAHRLQALTGACLAMRAQDFASVRGLDCRYINSQEDIDLCLRLLQIEGRRYCLSSNLSEVVHSEGRAPGRYGHSGWSRHLFVRRWAERITADDQSIYAADGMIVKTFKADKHEFERQGIGAGRALFEGKTKAWPDP
jgi:GT2 family glycosyltransferase